MAQDDGTTGTQPENENPVVQPEIRQKLEELKVEHRDLDDIIDRVNEEAPFDQIRMQRLKKRKLALRDQIEKLESELVPDIIA